MNSRRHLAGPPSTNSSTSRGHMRRGTGRATARSWTTKKHDQRPHTVHTIQPEDLLEAVEAKALVTNWYAEFVHTDEKPLPFGSESGRRTPVNGAHSMIEARAGQRVAAAEPDHHQDHPAQAKQPQREAAVATLPPVGRKVRSSKGMPHHIGSAAPKQARFSACISAWRCCAHPIRPWQLRVRRRVFQARPQPGRPRTTRRRPRRRAGTSNSGAARRPSLCGSFRAQGARPGVGGQICETMRTALSLTRSSCTYWLWVRPRRCRVGVGG